MKMLKAVNIIMCIKIILQRVNSIIKYANTELPKNIKIRYLSTSELVAAKRAAATIV